MPRRETDRPVPRGQTQQDVREVHTVSDLSRRISPSVEAQGRLQRLAAECAQRLAQKYEGGTGAATIRATAPDLMVAWLEGYTARVGDELAGAKADLALAEAEPRPRESSRR